MAAVRGTYQHYFHRNVPYYTWIDDRTLEACLDTRQIAAFFPPNKGVFGCRFPSQAAARLAGQRMIERAFQQKQAQIRQTWTWDDPSDPDYAPATQAIGTIPVRSANVEKQKRLLGYLANLSSFTSNDVRSLDPQNDPRILLRKLLKHGTIENIGYGRFIFTAKGREDVAMLAVANPLDHFERNLLIASGALGLLLIVIGLKKKLTVLPSTQVSVSPS